MKNLIAMIVIALMLALPFTTAAMQQGNEILPVEPGFGEKIKMREQLKEQFLGDQSYREQLRERIRNCVGDNSTECQEVKDEREEVIKGVMGEVCQNTEQIMERVRIRIQNNPKLTGEEKDSMIRVMKEQETELQGLCEQVEGANATKLGELVRERKQLMKETKVKFGLAKSIVHAKRVGLVLNRAEHLETKLQDFIEKGNVTNCGIENLTKEFSAKIDEARVAYNESIDLWQQFKESVQNHEPNTDLLREAQAKMQLAQLKLKEAHVVLKDIIVELRKCRQIEKVEENEKEQAEEQTEED
ncbi:MAG: hypothetical protein ACPLXC_03195 [Candidatus Pacearchaeota archaeon]